MRIIILLLAFGFALYANTVRIIQTSDLHACLTAGEAGQKSPLLQLGTLIAQSRAEVGSGNCLYIDTGDTMQGTLIGTLSRGQAPLRALLALQCDAWIPGNHDFDFGPEAFADTTRMMQNTLLCGNLFAMKEPTSWSGWRLFERNGVRIALIGSTASYLQHWFLPNLAKHYRVCSTREQLRRVLPEVMQTKPDAIVLAVHQGWVANDARGVNEVAAISQEFPEIDLILGAHTHRPFPGQRIGSHTWYVQPPPHGEAVAIIDIACDTKAHRVTEITSRLRYPERNTPEDASLREALSDDFARAAQFEQSVIAPPVGKSIDSGGRPGENNAMSQLFCAAIQAESQADVVLHGALSRTNLPADVPITGKMLFALVPYDNTIVTCRVSATDLEAIISEQWSKRKIYTYCGLYNAEAEIDAAGNAHLKRIAGAPVEQERRYLLALNSFTAAGSGRYPVLEAILARPESEMHNTGVLTRDALRNYLNANPHLVITPQRFLTH